MAISGVETKCYILSLFIRDDGERFVLGSGYYEFKEKQLHFQTNTIANDIVEVQGNDGYLLAGQVRRPGTQSFDGYIADGTVSKTETEAKRRAFFAFFRKNYFYKVIYVFPDGSAIQRKRGFLVDDPTVQELYQQYPEYHVALNFEDVNYYSYSEDDQGGEIFAKEAMIYLSAGATSGGLVWDNIGVEWDEVDGDLSRLVTVSGKSLPINNTNGFDTPTTDLKIKGDIFQQTYAGKNVLPRPYDDGNSIFRKGIQFTADSDGVITMTGQNDSTGNTAFYIVSRNTGPYKLKSGTYHFLRPSNTAVTLVMRSIVNGSRRWYNLTAENNYSVALADDTEITEMYIQVAKNDPTVFSNYKVYPMLSTTAEGTIDDYEPYVGGIPAPNPDYPQEVEVVTGTQAIAVNTDGQSQTYSIDLGDIELCKVGNYQDYIYKDGNNWYIHQAVRHLTLSVADMNNESNFPGWAGISVLSQDFPANTNVNINTLTDSQDNITGKNMMGSGNLIWGVNNRSRNIILANRNYFGSDWTQEYWIENYPDLEIDLYYGIVTGPIITQITDSNLISQLESLSVLELVPGHNDITTSSSGLSTEIEFSYRVNIEATGGAIWESGSGGGPTTVEVDSIDNVYPIWTVSGPAVNPQLSVLSTNTTINYAGTVTASQTLVIDMFNKTATLNGTSVIGNVYGDWVNFAPGNNRVVYTTNNADANPSIIQWQEVVG